MDTRARLLDIHSDIREDAAAPVDDAQFIESLIRPKGRPIDDSFKGKMFKNRFLNRVEVDFGLCLPVEAVDRSWSIDELAEYVADRAAKPEVNLRLAKKRIDEGRTADVTIYVVLGVVLLVPAIMATMPWRLIPIAVFVAVMAYLLANKRLNVAHYRTLAAQIDTGQN
ncbi:MAG: hypothetical protein ACR2O1_12045 [Boseongicola sp.]